LEKRAIPIIYNLCSDGRLVYLSTQLHFFSFTLFKVCSTSDRGLPFWPFLVRSRHYFGHALAFLAFPCPKLALLRTRSCLFGLSLSEVDTTSDTLLLFLLFRVRSCYYFGHTLAFLALFNPKLAQLRSHPCSFCSAFSEVEPIY
jgi:hypothetical protein